MFDVKPYLHGVAFRELENKAYFKLVTVSRYGIKWPNEQDFSSDTIVFDLTAEKEYRKVAESSEFYKA